MSVRTELKRQPRKADASEHKAPERGAQESQPLLITGFSPMTRLATGLGPFPAQALRERDMVRTGSGAFVQIRKVDRLCLNEDYLRHHPEAFPVLIQAGALGQGLPYGDVIVAPGQLVCTGHRPTSSNMVPAQKLLTRPGVMRKPESMVNYTRLDTGAPAAVQVEGVWAEIGI